MSPFSKQVAEHRDNKQIDEIRKQASQWQPERRVLSDVLYHWRGSLWQHHQQSKDYPDAGWSGNPAIDIIAILMMVSRRMPAFFDEILPKKTPNWATVPE